MTTYDILWQIMTNYDKLTYYYKKDLTDLLWW